MTHHLAAHSDSTRHVGTLRCPVDQHPYMNGDVPTILDKEQTTMGRT
jgi:hypothetical protein